MAIRRDSLRPRRASRDSNPKVQGPRRVKKEPREEVSRHSKRGDSSEKRERASPRPTNKNSPSPLPVERQKRPRDHQDSTQPTPDERPSKRVQSDQTRHPTGQNLGNKTATAISPAQANHISHWAENQAWPRAYFEHKMIHPLFARSKSTNSLRRKRSESSLPSAATPSDQRPREEKSSPYNNPDYPTLLEALGNSYLDESVWGITDASKVLCRDLLETNCSLPRDTLFRDDAFPQACRNLRDKNEARVIQDIGRLLVPSPETLTALHIEDLRVLNESVNEGWNSSVPVTSVRPQPDFAVGFKRSAFSDDQLTKIQPLLGDLSSLSYFRTTFYMYFPVLTCEVKCGNAALEIADRQNGHAMTIAVRGIVELFKLAKKENEVHRELLTFSISHDNRTVRLYGYYPIIDGTKTRIYRHPIHAFDMTVLDGKEKWTTYKFSVGVYNHSLKLLKRIRSVVDELPPDFTRGLATAAESQQAETELSGPSGLSQQVGDHTLTETPISEPNQVDLQEATPDPSTQAQAQAPTSTKKVRKNTGRGRGRGKD